MATPAPEQLGRVAQLTVRTNQFNLTNDSSLRKRDMATVDSDGASCLGGAESQTDLETTASSAPSIYYSEADRYRIETLLLSCRVLGRGVEHAVLASLAQRALLEGKRFVELTVRTDREEFSGPGVPQHDR